MKDYSEHGMQRQNFEPGMAAVFILFLLCSQMLVEDGTPLLSLGSLGRG